ncbi:MAG: diguanylate cyclase [Myxococcota bacterium]
MTTGSEPESTSNASYISDFVRRYVLALIGLGLLATITFASMGAVMGRTLADPADVNISGRQRTLSQHIAPQVSVLSAPIPEDQRMIHQNLLAQSISLMDHSHQALIEGNDEMGTSGALTPALEEHYFKPPVNLDANVEQFLSTARTALERSRDHQMVDSVLRAQVVSSSNTLLPQLDRAVALFHERADTHIRSAQIWMVSLYVATLGALMALWLGIFRPFTGLLRRDERKLTAARARQEKESALQSFNRQFNSALEMVDDEHQLVDLIERAMIHLGEDAPLELKLADSSQAHLRTVAVHPVMGAAGCDVETPWQCAAVRRGRPIQFNSSADLDSCPRLIERREQGCSALCVPVTFMGRAIGVLHSLGAEHSQASPHFRERVETMASSVGVRIDSIRNLEQFQLQAATDPLTGLLNRRALEEAVRPLIKEEVPFAVAMMDLDKFKRLNDTFGHDAGDRALSTFAKAVQEVVRKGDFVARFGGEEFVVIFPRCTAEQGARTLERVREHLARVTAGSDTPTFTASYGIADTRIGFVLDSLIQTADSALLRAKDQGRDRVLIADMGQEEESGGAPPLEEVA